MTKRVAATQGGSVAAEKGFDLLDRPDINPKGIFSQVARGQVHNLRPRPSKDWEAYRAARVRWLNDPTPENERALIAFQTFERQESSKFVEAFMAEKVSWGRR